MLLKAHRCALRGHTAVSKPSAHLRSRRISHRLSVRAEANDTAFASYTPRVAAFFPGQGAQSVGMAKDLVANVPAAKELFDKASSILGYDLLQLCVEGPKGKLDTTAISQPAIYVASLAAVEQLKATEGANVLDTIDVAAGLSLGEYTALVFAGAISFEDGLRLVKLRGESMQAAADAAPSGMVSVVGLDADKVRQLCEAASAEVPAGQGVRIANFLCPGNYAVSGGREGCAAVERLGKSFKARMTVRLAVAGAFHTDFMAPAVAKLQEALDQTTINTPRIPVISNVDAQPHSDPAVIRSILARQVTSPVLWENTIKTLLEKGLTKSYEIGPGKVISGIVKRIDKAHVVTNIVA